MSNLLALGAYVADSLEYPKLILYGKSYAK